MKTLEDTHQAEWVNMVMDRLAQVKKENYELRQKVSELETALSFKANEVLGISLAFGTCHTLSGDEKEVAFREICEKSYHARK